MLGYSVVIHLHRYGGSNHYNQRGNLFLPSAALIHVMRAKKAIRIISNTDYLAHSSKLFLNLNLLKKIDDIITFQLGTFMYKLKYNKLPSVIQHINYSPCSRIFQNEAVKCCKYICARHTCIVRPAFRRSRGPGRFKNQQTTIILILNLIAC